MNAEYTSLFNANTITIYHGSDKIIQQPQYGFSGKANDYGQGFYCTGDIERAREWAAGHDKENSCYVNKYSLNLADLNIFNFGNTEYNILHWLTTLLENRTLSGYDMDDEMLAAQRYLISKYHVDLSNTDVVIGYRADDSYFTFVRDFLSGLITLTQLQSALHLGNLGEQVVLISKEAFNALKFIGIEHVAYKKYYNLFMKNDSQARYLYRTRKPDNRDIRIWQIMDEDWSTDDARLL